MNAARKINRFPRTKKDAKNIFYFNPELLEPGDEIMRVAAKANTMKTTLWFTTDELAGDKKHVGYTHSMRTIYDLFLTCSNTSKKTLKRAKYKSDYDAYDENTKADIDKLQAELYVDWKKFKEDPYWMVKGMEYRCS